MRAGGGYTFLDRHPESILLPFAVLFGFTAYLNIAKAATSRGSVGAAWLPSALIGAACGIAVLAAIVVRFRADKIGWFAAIPPTAVLVGLLTTKSEIWAVPNPPGLVTTAFQNAELAFCGVSSLGLLAGLGWVYQLTGENRMAARRSARIPRGDLHISRATAWRESAANPIERGEWEELAERSGLGLFDPHSGQVDEEAIVDIMRNTGLDRAAAEERLTRRAHEQQKVQEFLATRPELTMKYPDEVAMLIPGPAASKKTFTITRTDGSRLMLQWHDAQVTVMGAGPDRAADAALLAPLARALDARVYDESGLSLADCVNGGRGDTSGVDR